MGELSKVSGFSAGGTNSGMRTLEFDTQLQQGKDDKKKNILITEQVRKDDPRVAEFRKKVEELKKKQGPLPPYAPIANPEFEGMNFGMDELAATKGPQIVLVGEDHKNTDHALALVGIVEGYELGKASDDTRRIILLDEGDGRDGYGEGCKSWNALSAAERLREGLGDHIARAQHFANAQEKQIYLEERVKTGAVHETFLAQTDMLNQLSKVRPDILIFPIDPNLRARNPVTGKYDKREAGRDSVMFDHIDAIRALYPNAILIVSGGYYHTIKNQKDVSNGKAIDDFGLDMNNPLAKQLSLEYGSGNVHSIAAIPFGAPLGFNSKNEVYSDFGQYDKIIHIDRYDKTIGWINPWRLPEAPAEKPPETKLPTDTPPEIKPMEKPKPPVEKIPEKPPETKPQVEKPPVKKPPV